LVNRLGGIVGDVVFNVCYIEVKRVKRRTQASLTKLVNDELVHFPYCLNSKLFLHEGVRWI
jgi:hypothetical protein